METSPERPQDMERSEASSSGVVTIGQTLKSVGKGKQCTSHEINTSEDNGPVTYREHDYTDKSKVIEQDQEDIDKHPLPISADPDSYLHAKRKLKKAVLEHYR